MIPAADEVLKPVGRRGEPENDQDDEESGARPPPPSMSRRTTSDSNNPAANSNNTAAQPLMGGSSNVKKNEYLPDGVYVPGSVNAAADPHPDIVVCNTNQAFAAKSDSSEFTGLLQSEKAAQDSKQESNEKVADDNVVERTTTAPVAAAAAAATATAAGSGSTPNWVERKMRVGQHGAAGGTRRPSANKERLASASAGDRRKEPPGVLLTQNSKNDGSASSSNNDIVKGDRNQQVEPAGREGEEEEDHVKEIFEKGAARTQSSTVSDPASIGSQPGAFNIRGTREESVESSMMSMSTSPNHGQSVVTAPVAHAGSAPPINEDPVVAVLVPEDERSYHDVVLAVEDTEPKKIAEEESAHNKRKRRFIFAGLVVLFLGVIIGLGGALGTRESHTEWSPTAAPLPQYYEVVKPIDGDQYSEFGTSVSMCSDGSRVAIGAQGSGQVQVFELDGETGTRTQVGQTIEHDASVTMMKSRMPDSMRAQNVSTNFIRSGIVVELAPNCRVLAIGTPFESVGDKTMAGQVALYNYNTASDSWEPLGNPNVIPGEATTDFAGASLALSQTGDRIAIGSPGNDWAGEDAGRVRVFLINSGRWEQLGSSINGTHEGEEFGGSISLSNDDTSDTYKMAVGGSSLTSAVNPDEAEFDPEAVAAARVYEFETGQWNQRGQGIIPDVFGIDTAWFVKLSGDGKKLVLSNLYLDPDGVGIDDNNEGIYVAAYMLDSQKDEWVRRGGNIHRNMFGRKSGYIISLSENGERIGMGDPGREGTGGLSGHAHIYQFNGDKWCQMGPDIDGESAGDMAGYSVALSGDGKRFVFSSPKSRAQGREHGRVSVIELFEERIVPNCDV